MYPYRIRVTDPIEIDVFKKVASFRAIDTKNLNINKKIGHKIPRYIKKDGFFIKDGIIAIINPKMQLEGKPTYISKRKGYDFTIKSIF